MKKMIFMAMMAICAVSANAQVWIGGNLGYDFDKNNGVKTHAISISPEVGYNLSDKWAIAANLDYTYGKVVNAGSVNTFTITPYVRYTFAKAGMASFFVDGGLEGGVQKVEGFDAEGVFGIGFQPGVALQISPKVSLVTKLGCLGYRHTDDHDQFGFGVNNETITFGAYYSF